MHVRKLLVTLALAGTMLTAVVSGTAAAASADHACLVGVIVSGSAGPGFGQETAGLAQSGTLDPAGVAATFCH